MNAHLVGDDFDHFSDGNAAIPASQIDQARYLMKLRSARETVFDPQLFGEPAWEMLLFLFVEAANRRDVDVSALALASGAPPATALRYIAVLEKLGLVFHYEGKGDPQPYYVGATPKALSAMRWLLEQPLE